MKKLFSLLLFLVVLATTPVCAETPIATGSVTLANMRLSLVNGTAFVDFSAAGSLTNYVGRKIVIADSAGKKATGYIKAAGTGETYGNERITNGGFDSDTGWTKDAGFAISEGLLIGTGITGLHGVSQTVTTIQKALYKAQFVLISLSSGTTFFYVFNTSLSTGTTLGTHTQYRSCPQTVYGMGLQTNGTNVNSSFDDVSLKQVLSPSTTGVTIVNTPGGPTQNWAEIESGFDPNDANGYGYTIYGSDNRGFGGPGFGSGFFRVGFF